MAVMSPSPADCLSTYPEAPARKASAASWASACIVRKINLILLLVALSWRIASNPLSTGMAISAIMERAKQNRIREPKGRRGHMTEPHSVPVSEIKKGAANRQNRRRFRRSDQRTIDLRSHPKTF